MDWLKSADSSNSVTTMSEGNIPSPLDNCGLHWCIVRDSSNDGGSCISKICWWGKGCFSNH